MTYAKNLFEGVPKKHVNKSRFNLSHEWKAGINMSKIIPILCEPVMPGDEVDIPGIEFMFRMPPLYYPIMQMTSMYCNLFYVPNRILWRDTEYGEVNNGWKGFITMADEGEQEHPYVTLDNQRLTNASENDTVMGYMGIPYWKEAVDWVDTITNINCLPLSAYLAIWDEYYRNPQLEPGRWFNLSEGDNTTSFQAAFGGFGSIGGPDYADGNRFRCFSSKWEKDYFTSALPTPQAGDPVQIPLIADYVAGEGNLGPTKWRRSGNTTQASDGPIALNTNADAIDDQNALIYPDIQSTAPDMRELRWAEALQTFKERILKVGQRYTDYIKGLFGNHPTPGSVDVPVWFGYYRGKIQISDVVQTATTSSETTEFKTGQYVGRADLYEKSNSFNIFCSEHGWIIGLLEVKPNTVYGQGIPRWFRYQLPTDYPLDIFAGIGDQEILKEEVAFNGFAAMASANQETFGYIPRYSEMKYRNNRWSSNMDSEFGKSQHLGRIWADEIFDTSPEYDLLEINETFINMYNPDPAQQRPQFGGLRETDVLTVLPLYNNSTSENTIFAHIFISMFVNRNLPMFSTPKLGV